MNDKEKARIIIREVSNFLQADPMRPTRKREVVECRSFCMHYMRKYTRMSLSSIGAMFGKDHATVLHACRTVNDLIQWNGYQISDGRMRFYIEKKIIEHPFEWCNNVAQL